MLYTPYDGQSHDIRFYWFPGTAAPTGAPHTRAPMTPSPATVHFMSDHDSVYSYYGTPQEWVISCTPGSTLRMILRCIISGFSLKLDNKPMYSGSYQFVTCPSSGKVSMLYTPYDGQSHDISFSWFPATAAPAGALHTWAPMSSAPPTHSPATVHYMTDHDSVSSYYSTPQEWLITCTPDSIVRMNVQYAPSGYTLMLDGSFLGSSRHVTCPSSGKVTLLYTPDDKYSHSVSIQWYPVTVAPTRTPDTPGPLTPIPATVHYMSDHDSVYISSSTPQEWVISCTPDSSLLVDVTDTPSGCLTLDGRSMSSGSNQRVTCPSSGEVSLLYTPYDGDRHTVRLQWHTATAVPSTSSPSDQDTAVPSTLAVHYMSDHDSVNHSSSTPQEWVIFCTPDSTLWMDVIFSPSGYKLKIDGSPLYFGYGQPLTCPSSGKMSLVYTPWDGLSHTVTFKWSAVAPAPTTPIPATMHCTTGHGSVDTSSITPQEWIIPCMPYSFVDVTVTQLPGTLTADTTTLHQGQRNVYCPSTGQVRLLYIPSSGTSQSLVVSWAAEGGAHTSQSESPLIVVTATVGVLALVCVTVAVYRGCRRRAADRKAHSSNVEHEGYADVGPTGVFGGLQDSCSSPDGHHDKQPVSEMEQQLLVDDSPVM